VLGGLKVDLSRAEARLQELNSRLGDNHPQVVELRANIKETQARLDAETRKVTGGVGVSNTINQSRETKLRAELAEQRGKVLRMRAARDEAQVLMREVESAQRAFEAVQARFTQTSLESQTTMSYINVLSGAAPPLQPSAPRTVLNMILAVLLGSILGLVAVMVRELFDRRLRASGDISDLLGVPMLGTLPRPRKNRLFGSKGKTPQLQNRILGALPNNTKSA